MNTHIARGARFCRSPGAGIPLCRRRGEKQRHRRWSDGGAAVALAQLVVADLTVAVALCLYRVRCRRRRRGECRRERDEEHCLACSSGLLKGERGERGQATRPRGVEPSAATQLSWRRGLKMAINEESSARGGLTGNLGRDHGEDSYFGF